MEHQNVLTKNILASVKQTDIELGHFLHIIDKQVKAKLSKDSDLSSSNLSTSEFTATDSKSSQA